MLYIYIHKNSTVIRIGYKVNSTKKDKKIAEEKLRKQTLEVDYLQPFLVERGVSGNQVLPPQLAIEIRERCLADLKQRLIDRANLIQARFKAVWF